MQFIRSLEIQGLLSFSPDAPPFELQDLNVLIGPNGSGKSNLIETIELLRATPDRFCRRDPGRRRSYGVVLERRRRQKRGQNRRGNR